MVYTYKTRGVCSRSIELDVSENGNINDIYFSGGCNGNAKGVRALVKGRNANEVVHLLEGIQCEGKATSCPDQLACALRHILDNSKPAPPGKDGAK